MLLNPENYELSRYKQKRRDGVEYGDSGPLYFGTAPGAPSVIIKQFYAMHVANEFIGCSLGKLLDVYAPQAWLFQKHKQIKRCSFQHSVGIEHLDGLSGCPRDVLYDDVHVEQTLRASMLHGFLCEDDGDSIGLWNDKIYAYDFAETFCLGNTGEGLIRVLTGKIAIPVTSVTDRLKDSYTDGATKAIKLIGRLAEVAPVSSEIINKVYSDMRSRYLEVHQNHGLDAILTGIAELYPFQVAELYSDLFDALADVLTQAGME